jgi:hypothetical protein
LGKYIVTNNPLVKEKLEDFVTVEYLDVDYLGLLEAVRDLVHQGAILLTHPLSGSVKPNETPYKSVLLTKGPDKLTDLESIKLIESAILTAKKFIADKPDYESGFTERVRKDCQLIDYTLIYSALPSAGISTI